MSNRIEYWLSFSGSDTIRFPVNPESIQVTSPYGFDDVEVTHLGEYSVFGERKLKSLSFKSFFPGEYHPSYCEYIDISSPETYIDKIEEWRDSQKPLRLVVTGTNINIPVTIREFTLEYERAGAIGDVDFTLALKEYRPQEYRKEIDLANIPTASEIKAAKRPPTINNTSQVGTKSYTVKSGDSLSKVFGTNWPKVYEANKDVIGANPNLIYPGQTLVIPS